MEGITWRDVRAEIPQPYQALDAVHGPRQVQARLWLTPAAHKPYKVEITLLEIGAVVETWTIEHQAGKGFNRAMVNFASGRERAEQWLMEAPRDRIRPDARYWTIVTTPIE